MSRYFPHTVYAEDQPLASTILVTHVLTRAITTGTIISGAILSIRQLVPSWRLNRPGAVRRPPMQLVLSSASTGSIAAMALVTLGTAARMAGREDIEWRDRSWRLLENEGQLETDDWTYAGMGAGVAAVAATRGGRAMGWRGVLGAAGWGSVVGMVGYLGWRHGVNGGKFPQNKKTERSSI